LSQSEQNIIESAVELGKESAEFQELYDDGELTHFAIPQGQKVVEIRNNAACPNRKSGDRNFTETKSFCHYVNLHKTPATLVVADEKTAKAKAIFNAHGEEPGWGDFTTHLDIGFSKQWRIWSSAEGNRMDQSGFAEFLENNRTDFMVGNIPDGDGKEIENISALELSSIIENLEATFQEKFTSKVDRVSGRRVLHYENDEVGKGTLSIPRQFILAIPIYKGGDIFQITIRMLHRLGNGQAKFFFIIDQAEVLKEKAFDMICRRINGGNVGSEKDPEKVFEGVGIEVLKGDL